MLSHARLVEPLPMEMGKRKKHHQVVRYSIWFGVGGERHWCLSTQQNQEKVVVLVFNPHFIGR